MWNVKIIHSPQPSTMRMEKASNLGGGEVREREREKRLNLVIFQTNSIPYCFIFMSAPLLTACARLSY